MKDILVVVEGQPPRLGSIRVAAQLAKSCRARIMVAVADQRLALSPLGLYAAGQVFAEELEEQKRQLTEEIHRQIAALMSPMVEDVQWNFLRDRSPGTLAQLSFSADLVVATLGSDDGDDHIRFNNLAHFVTQSGRPFLVLPTLFDSGPIGRRVTIGWDGGRESSRAVHDALPILRRADSVELTIVAAAKAEPAGAAPGQSIVDHLARHGVPASIRLVSTDIGHGVDGALLAAAEDHQADLMIMGAFGASRLREMLLGGVTKSVLRQTRIPVFLSH